MAGRFDMTAKVVSIREVAPETFLLTLHAPEIAEYAVPGQFVMIRPRQEAGFDPLLRRPFSIHRVHAQQEHIEILFRVVGRGTRLLAKVCRGSVLCVLGPLGKGFEVRPAKIPVLVGGGLGVAPLLFLADRLKGGKGVIILGALTKGFLLRLDAFSLTGLDVLVATEDGSFGNKGLVTEVLNRLLGRLEAESRRQIIVFSCGPIPMLRAVAGLSKSYQVECQVSLEAYMACGIGLCMGCAIRAGRQGYLHVCKDGPVFPANLIDWDQI